MDNKEKNYYKTLGVLTGKIWMDGDNNIWLKIISEPAPTLMIGSEDVEGKFTCNGRLEYNVIGDITYRDNSPIEIKVRRVEIAGVKPVLEIGHDLTQKIKQAIEDSQGFNSESVDTSKLLNFMLELSEKLDKKQ